ncbi:hypothetical protein FF1_011265 [Malus domestica]
MKEAMPSHLRLDSCFLMSQETILYVTLEPCPNRARCVLEQYSKQESTLLYGELQISFSELMAAGYDFFLMGVKEIARSSEHSEKPAPPVHPFHPNMTIRRGVLASDCADIMQQFFQLSRPGSAPASSSNFSPSIKVTYEDASHLPHNVLFVRVQRLLV